jgi:hypothetical protein
MQNAEIQMVPLALYQELEQKYNLLQHELAQLKRKHPANPIFPTRQPPPTFAPEQNYKK